MTYDDNTEFVKRSRIRYGFRNWLSLAISVLSIAYGVAIIASPIISCLALFRTRRK